MITDKKFEELKASMSQHFIKEYPREACGIITTNWEYIPCRNLSSSPKNSFVLDPVSLLKYEDTTWGIVHSHPGSENPVPSEKDIASTVFDCYKFIVGFADKFYIYWYSKKLESLIYEELEPLHFNDNSKIS